MGTTASQLLHRAARHLEAEVERLEQLLAQPKCAELHDDPAVSRLLKALVERKKEMLANIRRELQRESA